MAIGNCNSGCAQPSYQDLVSALREAAGYLNSAGKVTGSQTLMDAERRALATLAKAEVSHGC